MQPYKTESLNILLRALAAMDTPEDCCAFLEDLCTIKELQDMAQRFETAILRIQGKNYQEIVSRVGTSTATISRVSRCLNYGSGGYKKAIDNLEKQEAQYGNQG